MPNEKKLTLTFTVAEAQELVNSVRFQAGYTSSTDFCFALAEKIVDAVMKAEGRQTVTCSKCGGSNVQNAAWVRPNTGEVVNDEGPIGDTWCEDCDY